MTAPKAELRIVGALDWWTRPRGYVPVLYDGPFVAVVVCSRCSRGLRDCECVLAAARGAR